jgi:hypothetical protein
MKKLLAILLALMTVSVALAQEKPRSFLAKLKKKPKVEVPAKYPNEYLDTVNLNKKIRLNNYNMIGFEYGVSRNSQLFTPRFQSQPVFFPEYFGVTFTRYGELIGSPIVGFQIGAFYGHEGYEFKIDEDTGGVFVIEEATKVEMRYAEVPFLAVGHYDMPNFKIQMCVGPYAGYRLDIHRSGPFAIDPELVDNFTSYDKRFDYGIHGGAGFAIIVDPFEFQVNLRVRYSWSSLWEPNFNSEYYYRYAYPFDFMLTGGLHFHLTRRYGKTRGMLRREAKNIVFNPPVPDADTPGEDW